MPTRLPGYPSPICLTSVDVLQSFEDGDYTKGQPVNEENLCLFILAKYVLVCRCTRKPSKPQGGKKPITAEAQSRSGIREGNLSSSELMLGIRRKLHSMGQSSREHQNKRWSFIQVDTFPEWITRDDISTLGVNWTLEPAGPCCIACVMFHLHYSGLVQPPI